MFTRSNVLSIRPSWKNHLNRKSTLNLHEFMNFLLFFPRKLWEKLRDNELNWCTGWNKLWVNNVSDVDLTWNWLENSLNISLFLKRHSMRFVGDREQIIVIGTGSILRTSIDWWVEMKGEWKVIFFIALRRVWNVHNRLYSPGPSSGQQVTFPRKSRFSYVSVIGSFAINYAFYLKAAAKLRPHVRVK